MLRVVLIISLQAFGRALRQQDQTKAELARVRAKFDEAMAERTKADNQLCEARAELAEMKDVLFRTKGELAVARTKVRSVNICMFAEADIVLLMFDQVD